MRSLLLSMEKKRLSLLGLPCILYHPPAPPSHHFSMKWQLSIKAHLHLPSRRTGTSLGSLGLYMQCGLPWIRAENFHTGLHCSYSTKKAWRVLLGQFTPMRRKDIKTNFLGTEEGRFINYMWAGMPCMSSSCLHAALTASACLILCLLTCLSGALPMPFQDIQIILKLSPALHLRHGRQADTACIGSVAILGSACNGLSAACFALWEGQQWWWWWWRGETKLSPEHLYACCMLPVP